MPGWKPLIISDAQSEQFTSTFRRRAKFLVDENMGEDAAEVLREFGCWAKYVGEVGLLGRSDEEVFAFAWKKRWIILTHDDDFLDDRLFPFHRNSGVIVLPGAEGNGALEVALADIIRLVAPYGEPNKGAKIRVTEDRIWTVRKFDKDTGEHTTRRIKLVRGGRLFEWDDS